jgi:hypothetical protein
VLSLAFAALALTQAGRHLGGPEAPEVPTVDPYTGGEADAMARAGYVSFGPFAWGNGHDTLAIEAVVAAPGLRWVETAHFKLGCALPEMDRPDERDAREELAQELKRLAAKLDGPGRQGRAVDPKARTIDPWLRLHLLAQRLEELYASFCERMDIDTSRFPGGEYFDTLPGQPSEANVHMGAGPHLGQRGKYTVLVLETAASFGRYENAWLGGREGLRRRYHFMEQGSLFYGDALELHEEDYRTDVAVTCALVHGVAQNLADGYRSFQHELPGWFREGLGQWFAREVDERFVLYTLAGSNDPGDTDSWEWNVRVRARVGLGNYPAWEEQLELADVGGLERSEHMFLWSRVDYLMARGDAGRLLHFLKEPLRGTSMTRRQRQAFDATFGKSPAELDGDWAAWVLATYPVR